jgi:hypothetical protein
MKKYILLVVSAIALAFTSCSDSEEIEIKYQVNVTVDPSTVKSAFHGYLANGVTYGLNMDETSKLLITTLIYDNSGILIDKKESLVNDYNTNVKYSLNMKDEEEFTVVAITFSVDNTHNVSSYLIENENQLDKLTITSKYPNGNSFYSSWSMLGLVAKTINPENRENVINVKPASSIVVLTYNNIHFFDENGVDKHWIAYKNNIQAKFENGNFEYKATSAVNSGWVHSLDVTEEPNSNNIFVMLNLLPTPNMAVWAGFSVGERNIPYSDFLDYCELDPTLGEGSINIEAGKEYRFDVFCSDCTIKLGNLTRSSAAASQSILSNEVNKNKVDNKSYTPNIITPQQSANVMELVKTLK